MVRGAESEATQKIATAGNCYYPGNRRAVRTGGVTRLQKSRQIHSCWIIMEELWSGVGATEEPTMTRATKRTGKRDIMVSLSPSMIMIIGSSFSKQIPTKKLDGKRL